MQCGFRVLYEDMPPLGLKSLLSARAQNITPCVDIIPFFDWILARMSPIAINRANGRRVLRDIGEQDKQRLSDGFYIVIFPEGTRLAPDEHRSYQSGGEWLAKHLGVAAVDSGRCWRKNSFLKRQD